jgi:hypothetical protein
MHLHSLSDEALHLGNIQKAKEERELLTCILHHLHETERRRLYSAYRCKSLFDYAVKFMHYSNDQADRRIKAMRLLRDVPQIEEKINEGSLNLTNLALAQKLFTLEKKSGQPMNAGQKTELLAKLENKSTREAEKIVFDINPEMRCLHKELTFNHIEDEVLREKLLQAKGLFAHTHPFMNLSELLHKLCDQALEKKTKVSRAPKMNSRAEIERHVWRRDGHRCTNCRSTHAVQVEHIIPEAVGGPYTLENLCLLCRPCNQRRAIEYFGLDKMDRYINGRFERSDPATNAGATSARSTP